MISMEVTETICAIALIIQDWQEGKHEKPLKSRTSLQVQLSLKLSQVKVKRKGQVTIPIELRRKFSLHDGSLLEAQEHEGGILLKSLPPAKAGRVVGERAYKEIISKLEESRRKKWR